MKIEAASGITAAGCLFYGIFLLLSEGRGLPYWWIWFPAACWFAGPALAQLLRGKCGERIPERAAVSAATFWLASTAVFLTAELFVLVGCLTPEAGGLDYLIVAAGDLGGKHAEEMTRSRLDRAIRYMEKNPQTMLILSDSGRMSGIPAAGMRDYLLYNGVEAERILTEESAENLLESLAWAQILIGRQENREEADLGPDRPAGPQPPGPYLMAARKPADAGILTEGLRMLRSRRIAKKRGISQPGGVLTETPLHLLAHTLLTEGILILKDQFMGNT